MLKICKNPFVDFLSADSFFADPIKDALSFLVADTLKIANKIY